MGILHEDVQIGINDFVAKPILASGAGIQTAHELNAHGVFAPNSHHRALVTPSKRGKNNKCNLTDEANERTLTERRPPLKTLSR